MIARPAAALLLALFAAPLPAALALQIDHRLSQSPVKQQGARGTCVAFSLTAAMEVFPGVPTDLSEQVSYALVKLQQQAIDDLMRRMDPVGHTQIGPNLSIGDSLATYVMLTQRIGTPPAAFYPYHPNPRTVADTVPQHLRRVVELAQVDPETFPALASELGKYRLAESDVRFLSRLAAMDVQRLQRELEYGRLAIPVTYLCHAGTWSELASHANHDGDGRRNLIHPGMMHSFAVADGEPMNYGVARMEASRLGTSLVDAVLSGRFRRVPVHDERYYGGHAVTIVGFDDYGFWIKNSWGTEWGEGGYARISYDYHRLYVTGAVLIDRVSTYLWDVNTFARTQSIRDADWRLKVAPGWTGRDEAGNWQRSWMLSVWAHGLREPNADAVEYRVEVQQADGHWSEVLRRAVLGRAQAERQGSALVLSAEEHARVAASRAVRVAVRFGVDFGADPARAEYLVERSFGLIPPDLFGARDLAPNR